MKDMDSVLMVITNMPDAESAAALAQQIVAARLAACVNQLAPCTSVYRWQEKVETATEIPLLIKTTRTSYASLEALILAEHPYDVPEIIAVTVSRGLPAYLDWVRSETGIVKE